MKQLIDVANRKVVKDLFLALDPAAKPLWGKMTAQQMVEHLISQVQYTNGKKEPSCRVPKEEAEMAKQDYIYTDLKIPRNVVLSGIPEIFVYPDLTTAVNQLMIELTDFDRYFDKPGTLVIHGGFGAMDYNEWLIWHGKHFTHHLEQFGLIGESI
ncbi:DUF1569 domain-containing protein [Pedobacter sp. PAMC26386]|nr:DUF1569 domain-containing protein [Pedobacter sp. PAMC26386]